jgi:hypothetical protein
MNIPRRREGRAEAVIVAWIPPGHGFADAKFERSVPLAFNGERNRRLGSSLPIHLVFLEGFSCLGEEYREKLAACGYVLHDAETLYRRHAAGHPALERFGGYETKCFLRWLVIEDLFGAAPFAHFDGDIVFNAIPEKIMEAFAGLTFFLQGCPAFTLVHDSAWSRAYRDELKKFSDDVAAYSARAWRRRPAFENRSREGNNYLWTRETLSSDQDLLEFLAFDGRIPHADAGTLEMRNPFALFQNPLTIGRDLPGPLPVAYRRPAGGTDRLGEKEVAFWHLQSDFTHYLGYAAFRSALGLGGRVSYPPRSRAIDYRVFPKLCLRFHAYNRLALCQRYFGGGAADLGFLLNGQRWHEAGIFV